MKVLTHGARYALIVSFKFCGCTGKTTGFKLSFESEGLVAMFRLLSSVIVFPEGQFDDLRWWKGQWQWDQG